METCQIEGCDSPVLVKSRGWCAKHYHRWHRSGDPLQAAYVRTEGTPMQRWEAKVDKTGDCWVWTASLDKHGYGQFDVTDDGVRRNHRAHRWGYQQLVRPLATAETLDHLCRNHACVRPAHLDPVLHAVNVARGESGRNNASKTHCPQGHPYDDANTYVQPGSTHRACRACIRDRARRRRGTSADAVPNGNKTHCKHGHEFTPENTITRKDGRACRECGRRATADYMRRRREQSE